MLLKTPGEVITPKLALISGWKQSLITSMALLEKQLFIKRSQIPKAGKGLFTKEPISKGSYIVEYKGKVCAWKDIPVKRNINTYVYYINRNHVIDALPNKKALARYANDANGVNKVERLVNNSRFIVEDGRVFIIAKKNIVSYSEILVGYKREFWKE